MTERDCLADVKSWMTFLGWSNGGGPGATKGASKHGGAEWIKDTDHALDQIEHERAREALAELARRSR